MTQSTAAERVKRERNRQRETDKVLKGRTDATGRPPEGVGTDKVTRGEQMRTIVLRESS